MFALASPGIRGGSFNFTPTTASWINAVVSFFSALKRRRLKIGDFRSVVDLQAASNGYVAHHNHSPRPFD